MNTKGANIRNSDLTYMQAVESIIYTVKRYLIHATWFQLAL